MTVVLFLLVVSVLFLAYSNGANDNFKGVATLYGSRTCGYRTALAWATITTLAGSLLALVLAHGLVQTFRGKGLVPDAAEIDSLPAVVTESFAGLGTRSACTTFAPARRW